MTHGNDPGEDGSSFTPGEEEMRRELLEQFYELAVERYGADSEQARMSSQLLRKKNTT